MSSHSIFGAFDCTLDALLEDDYFFFQEESTAEKSLFPVFGNTLNKRKPHNKRYEWEVIADD